MYSQIREDLQNLLTFQIKCLIVKIKQKQKLFKVASQMTLLLEHSLSIKNYGGDVAKVSTHMANIPKTISACYTGSHSLCRLHSLACRGLKTNNWVLKSAYLSNPFKVLLTTQ